MKFPKENGELNIIAVLIEYSLLSYACVCVPCSSEDEYTEDHPRWAGNKFFFFHFPATDATIEVDGARYITSRLTVVFVVLVCVCVAYRSSSSYIFFGRVDKISHEYGNYITYRLTKRVDGRNNITMKKEDYTLVTTWNGKSQMIYLLPRVEPNRRADVRCVQKVSPETLLLLHCINERDRERDHPSCVYCIYILWVGVCI